MPQLEKSLTFSIMDYLKKLPKCFFPQSLDEFKPSKLDRFRLNALYNHFRDAYDGHEGVRGRMDQTAACYELLAPLVVAGEESADEAAVRERSVELLFSKRDLAQPKYNATFENLCANEPALQRLGRSLLDTALRVDIAEVKNWYGTSLELFPKEFPTRIISNLACCEVGLYLLDKLCGYHRLSWSTVFPLDRHTCREQLVYAAREYLLDGGTHNKSVVEQTLEVMSRMGLTHGADYAFEQDGEVLCLWLNHVYDLLTKYCKDHAVVGELLPYAQFKRQLAHSDFFIVCNAAKRFGGEIRKVWKLDFARLKEHCDVEGFGNSEPEAL